MEINRLKFYADTPSGEKNKQFTWSVKNYEHAVDLAAKFVQEHNFKIRAAYYVNPLGKSIRFDKMEDLDKHKNSLIEQQDRERKLRLFIEKYNL